MTALKKVDILLPPLPEQKAIAQILTAFDDKIELLQAQNKTLDLGIIGILNLSIALLVKYSAVFEI
jgi:restriction endonuclease S subunit